MEENICTPYIERDTGIKELKQFNKKKTQLKNGQKKSK